MSYAALAEAFPTAPRPLLDAIGSHSPYLSGLALREPDAFLAAAADPDAVCDTALGTLAQLTPALRRDRIAAGLRQAKRRVALAAAIADIGGCWSLEQVTSALSDLADGALRVATAHLMRAAHGGGDLRLPHPESPEQGCGFVVLAMGKLGARELNFSSDVDLILIYEPEAHPYNTDNIGQVFTRIARGLVGLMATPEGGGTVFRVDLRLRPDPGSTPPAVALPGALAYYESVAQTWERAAMIKARPVAGDAALGRRFLAAIRPFVWRRHLDFAAIADIQAMKQRMDTHRGAALAAGGSPVARLLGHDLKLGEGGIREIEFCAQTLQLVWGGRNPALRAPGTLAALAAERDFGHLPAAAVRDLEAAYRFLRAAEHRLQMVADRQTHTLPASAAAFDGFAGFFGRATGEALAAETLAHLDAVHAIFAGLFRSVAVSPDVPPPAAGPVPDWPAFAMRGAEPPWEGWLAGRPRALRTERSRALLAELLPRVIAAVARQADPAAALARLDELVYRLPAGVQVFSMLRHNPALLERLADVLGAAPWLADHLARAPAALEGLVSPEEIDPDPAASLRAQLADARGPDDAFAIASRIVRGEEFSLAVAEFFARIGTDAAGLARTALADAVIAALLPVIMDDHASRYGDLPGGGLVVVALGKAGSREMMAGSDLDLMLIYDHPADSTESTGPRRLPASQYFARAAQAVIAALTVPTRDGPLYAVDMRLRPSGRAGPVAVSLASFAQYHRDAAWTWERLALTRARVVAGPAPLRARVARAIQAALRTGDRAAILPDTAAMRARVLRDHPAAGAWDVKLRRGGLIDVEFCAQALQLCHASATGLLSPITRDAFAGLARIGALPEADAVMLTEADRIWRGVQGLLRIAHGRTIPKRLAAPVLEKLSLVAGTGPDEAGLHDRLDRLAAKVGAAFARHVGEIDAS